MEAAVVVVEGEEAMMAEDSWAGHRVGVKVMGVPKYALPKPDKGGSNTNGCTDIWEGYVKASHHQAAHRCVSSP